MGLASVSSSNVLRATHGRWSRPVETRSSSRFGKRGAIYAIGWDGSGLRRITDGFALAVWVNPATGVEWVYAGVRERPTDPPSYRAVRRYRIDNPDRGERVWNAQPLSGDGFQLSRDGRYAAGLFPWPDAGTADLAAGTWERLGRGCWTAFSGGEDRMFWYFDGSHRHLTLVDIEADRRWRVTINGAPGVDGLEVWHPRWTNDSRYLVLTGPLQRGTAGEQDPRRGQPGRSLSRQVQRRFHHDRQLAPNDPQRRAGLLPRCLDRSDDSSHRRDPCGTTLARLRHDRLT